MTYPVYFEENGEVEFKYRKDSIGTGTTYYGVFSFIMDGVPVWEDKNAFHETFFERKYSVPAGFHTLVWRYSKLNIIPFTEFMEAEIESITIRGRHTNSLTNCFPCNLGHSQEGSGKCDVCPANSYFYINSETGKYFCA